MRKEYPNTYKTKMVEKYKKSKIPDPGFPNSDPV